MIGDRTSAKPRIHDGVTFHCYHVGIGQYKWRSDCGRFGVLDWGRTYGASVDDKLILDTRGEGGKRFRSVDNAMKAAVKAGKK